MEFDAFTLDTLHKLYNNRESDSKSDLFRCAPCHKSFSTERKWAKHMQRHRGEPGVGVIPDCPPPLVYKKKPKGPYLYDVRTGRGKRVQR